RSGAPVTDSAGLEAVAGDRRTIDGGLGATHAVLAANRQQASRRRTRVLDDGAQQGIVAVGLALRAVEASIPAEHQQLCVQVSNIVDGLVGVSTELQEISRGMHPAILS